jgi:hypothetical protein
VLFQAPFLVDCARKISLDCQSETPGTKFWGTNRFCSCCTRCTRCTIQTIRWVQRWSTGIFIWFRSIKWHIVKSYHFWSTKLCNIYWPW